MGLMDIFRRKKEEPARQPEQHKESKPLTNVLNLGVFVDGPNILSWDEKIDLQVLKQKVSGMGMFKSAKDSNISERSEVMFKSAKDSNISERSEVMSEVMFKSAKDSNISERSEVKIKIARVYLKNPDPDIMRKTHQSNAENIIKREIDHIAGVKKMSEKAGFEVDDDSFKDIDAKMIVDVVSEIYEGNIDGIVLATRDKDFKWVMKKAKEKGKKVILAAPQEYLPDDLKSIADKYIQLKFKKAT
ncbi:MAG: hypothetical protein CVT88_01455 [Candidatus Altiarchaeales archaeon HGW-Altiarchaeales-1]|nr:MAG: hypothetical protein CVT88_01455 [Candidatus Altiarchaeales archaeon HGW-Altiarchaeales-1]